MDGNLLEDIGRTRSQACLHPFLTTVPNSLSSLPGKPSQACPPQLMLGTPPCTLEPALALLAPQLPMNWSPLCTLVPRTGLHRPQTWRTGLKCTALWEAVLQTAWVTPKER